MNGQTLAPNDGEDDIGCEHNWVISGDKLVCSNCGAIINIQLKGT